MKLHKREREAKERIERKKLLEWIGLSIDSKLLNILTHFCHAYI